MIERVTTVTSKEPSHVCAGRTPYPSDLLVTLERCGWPMARRACFGEKTIYVANTHTIPNFLCKTAEYNCCHT